MIVAPTLCPASAELVRLRERSEGVMDRLKVAPIGRPDERTVIARMILGAQPRASIINTAGTESCVVERIYHSSIWCGEGKGHITLDRIVGKRLTYA